MMTLKQRTAIKRNSAKRSIIALYNQINSPYFRTGLTQEELSRMDDIKFKMDQILIRWDPNSENLGIHPKKPTCANNTCKSPKKLVNLYRNNKTGIEVFLCKYCCTSSYSLIEYENPVLGQLKEAN